MRLEFLLFLSGLQRLQGILRVNDIILLLDRPDDFPIFDVIHGDKSIGALAEILFKPGSGPVER